MKSETLYYLKNTAREYNESTERISLLKNQYRELQNELSSLLQAGDKIMVSIPIEDGSHRTYKAIYLKGKNPKEAYSFGFYRINPNRFDLDFSNIYVFILKDDGEFANIQYSHITEIGWTN